MKKRNKTKENGMLIALCQYDKLFDQGLIV